jgi:hypothetical protein
MHLACTRSWVPPSAPNENKTKPQEHTHTHKRKLPLGFFAHPAHWLRIKTLTVAGFGKEG